MVSRLCISQWQQAWRIYFLLLQFLLFSVILQCFIIYVFWVLYSWLLRCDCCQNWQMCFFYTNELYTQQNSLTPKCAFYYRLLCVKVVLFFFFFVFFILNLFWKIDRIRIVVTIFVESFYIYLFFFRIWLLLKISRFLKCSSVAECGICFSFSSLCLFNTWGELGWLRSQIELKRHSLILTD